MLDDAHGPVSSFETDPKPRAAECIPRPRTPLEWRKAEETDTPAPLAPSADWTDAQLVEACLSRDERAWALLIGRYKRTIYAFARGYGACAADAADVFQLVSAELFLALPRLRQYHSVRSWIMTVASHQAYQWKRLKYRRVLRDCASCAEAATCERATPATALEMEERERVVREAIDQLEVRDQQLVYLLFFEDPPVPYERVARRLGLATGSIGLTRARCLKKLKRILESAGVAS